MLENNVNSIFLVISYTAHAMHIKSQNHQFAGDFFVIHSLHLPSTRTINHLFHFGYLVPSADCIRQLCCVTSFPWFFHKSMKLETNELVTHYRETKESMRFLLQHLWLYFPYLQMQDVNQCLHNYSHSNFNIRTRKTKTTLTTSKTRHSKNHVLYMQCISLAKLVSPSSSYRRTPINSEIYLTSQDNGELEDRVKVHVTYTARRLPNLAVFESS